MSKKKLTQDVVFCDACGTDKHVYSHCGNCGVDHCYECAKKLGKTYSHGVYCGGSGDGYYCTQCQATLHKTGDVRFMAYLRIQDLRAECERWSADFNARQTAAEKAIRDLQP